MRKWIFAAAAIAALSAPASADEVLRLICQCRNVVVNGEPRSCAGQSERTAVIDLNARTLQWSNSPSDAWPAIPATITPDQIEASVSPGVARAIAGRLMIGHYTINRITGAFAEEGLGHTTDSDRPGVDIIVPGRVDGLCRKVEAAQF